MRKGEKLKVGSNWKLEGGMRKAEKTEGGKVRRKRLRAQGQRKKVKG